MGEVQLPLAGTAGHTKKGQRKTWRASGQGQTWIRPGSSTGHSKGAKMVYFQRLAAVEKFWSGKAIRNGHMYLVLEW